MTTSFENSDQGLIDELKILSDDLSLKISSAKENQFIPDSSNALFETILKGVDALVIGCAEMAQLNDSRGVELYGRN